MLVARVGARSIERARWRALKAFSGAGRWMIAAPSTRPRFDDRVVGPPVPKVDFAMSYFGFSRRRPAILLVEDDRFTSVEIEVVLEAAGYEVVSASTHRDGLDLVARYAVACALVDDEMLDGASEALTAELSARGIPFLITSGLRPRGADAVSTVSKPIVRSQLLAAIARMRRLGATDGADGSGLWAAGAPLPSR